MATLKDITLYALCKNTSISRSELTKLVYLFDYFHAKKFKKQYTNIRWYYDRFGPFVHDVENSILGVDGIKRSRSLNPFGKRGTYFSYSGECPDIDDQDLVNILDYVIGSYKEHTYKSFIEDLVYQTSPVKKTRQYDYINIEKCVAEEMDEAIDECFNEAVRDYGDVLTALAR
jgi:hypothetical protein